jgi:beta-phosphoglucomutase-like phosphatase (HAD superfamily)
MNKLVIFDLDGVLIDSRELHYEALNQALAKVDSKYIISREEHLSVFDGLNTTKKLNLLSQLKGLPSTHYDDIWKDKQKSTLNLILQCIEGNSYKKVLHIILKNYSSCAPQKVPSLFQC